MDPNELQKQIESLLTEKQQIIETANLRAAWYDGRIHQLEVLTMRAAQEIEAKQADEAKRQAATLLSKPKAKKRRNRSGTRHTHDALTNARVD